MESYIDQYMGNFMVKKRILPDRSKVKEFKRNDLSMGK